MSARAMWRALLMWWALIIVAVLAYLDVMREHGGEPPREMGR